MRIVFLGNSNSILAQERFEVVKEEINPDYIEFFHTTAFEKNKFKKVYFYISKFFELWLLIFNKRITHLHYHGAYHFIFNFLSILNVKVIVTPQGSDINQDVKKKRVFQIVRFLFKQANYITVKSSQMKLKVRNIYEHQHIYDLNWGISNSFFENNYDKIDNKIKILSMRATGKIYNIDLVFRLVKQLKKDYQNIEFTYVEYNKDPSINLDLSLCDKVHRQLSKASINELLKQNDFVLSLPSYDGFSTTIMETLAVGAYPIISNIDSYQNEFNEEILTKVNLENYDVIYEKISKLTENIEEIRNQKRIRQQYALDKYSYESQVKVLKEMYKNDKGN